MSDFAIRPHPLAPELSYRDDGVQVLEDLVKEVQSSNFSTSDRIRELLRQCGFVSLWFFLKFIAGYAGPYHWLNTGLHLDMANFRQSDDCMAAGAKAAMFIFRTGGKTSIGSHGANTWEVLRNPNIRIRIVNAVIDKAEQFRQNSMHTFKFNEFFGWLYPEYVIPGNQAKLIVPCREKHYSEPNIKVGGAGGAAEGDHHDLIDLDDLVGLDDLDAEHIGNANLAAKRQWFLTNTEMLLVNQDSRIFMPATLFAMDDPQHVVLKDMRELKGYRDPDYAALERKDGSWVVYYRSVLEDGIETLPEIWPRKRVEKVLRDDRWTAITQLFNKPKAAGMTEFSGYETYPCKLMRTPEWGYVIERGPDPRYDEEDVQVIPLSLCDCVIGWDPAFTEKGIGSKTSKTAIVTGALDWTEKFYVISVRAGYWDIVKVFDILFEEIQRFEGYARTTVIETNASQKGLPTLFQRERNQRGLFCGFTPRNVSTDKIVRIRSGIGRYLMKGNLYVEEKCRLEFEGEKEEFPSSKYKIDILDATEKVCSEVKRPDSPEERYERELDEEDILYDETVNVVTGY